MEDIDYILSKSPTIVRGQDSFSVFSQPLEVPAGKRIGLDVFAKSAETFLDHVRFQLKHFARGRDPREELKLFIFCPKDWTGVLLDFLREEMKISEENFLNPGTVDREYPTMFICKKHP